MRIFNKTTIVNQTIKTSIVVLLAVFSSFGLKAQLAASLAAATGNYGNGEEFCVDLIVDDFTDFYFVNFSIGWNPNILEFVSAEALDADGELNLTDANFFTNRIAEGLFTFNWEDPTEEGVTIRTRNLEDNYGIFRLCFRTSDQCGGFTKIDINEASETVLRAGAGNRNIGFTEDEVFDAEITVEGTPVTITASQVVANPEEVVCISITAEEFSDVEGVQYSLVWDTTILKFQNIDNINPDFPFLSTSAINTMNATDEGFIIFSWFTSSGGGVSVPDNTPMFDVCFQVVGEGGNSSLVQFSSEPRAIEIATSNEGSDACNLMNNGRVSVREQEGEVTIKAGSGAVKPGESICVDFSVRDFIAVNEMNFSINWDPDVLAFESIENLSLSNSGLGDFFTTNAATGFLTFTWDDINGELKQDDEVIFSICFTAVGAVGSSTPISFSGEPQPILVSTTSTVNAGLNTRNGMVTILPPESLNLNIANATVSPNEEFCVDITAENFSEIVGLEFSLGWETTQIDFVSVTNFGVDGLDESDFDLSNTASGFLSLDWSSTNAAGENLSDEEVLFSICFRAKTSAQLGLCDAIFFNDFPDPIQAVTSNSGGNSIEVTDQGNDICIFDPGGLTVNVTDGLEAAPQEVVCVPFTVRNFTDLSTVNFSVNWNPSIFKFENINISGLLTGLNLADFTTNLSNLGIITMSWTNPAGTGLTLSNGDVVFELCLSAVGERLSCTNLEVTSSPVPYEVKSPATGETNLSLNPLNGQLCVADALEVELVTSENPNCTDSQDGSISVIINGGNPSAYEYFWRDAEGNAVGVNATINNLPAGTYILDVTDDMGLSLSDTIILEAQNEPPIANAGQDFTLSCGRTTAVLQGLGSTVGENISFNWNVLQGSGTQANQSLLVNMNGGIDVGIFELVITNDSTTCSARDTVQVFLSELPNVDAGEDQVLTCQQESVTLDGSNSDQSDGSIFIWTTRDGGEIAGDSTSLTQTIDVAGTYILILNQGENCVARDTVVITDTRRNIMADAGVNKILDCSGEAVILGGNNTTIDENILLQWENSTGEIIETGRDSITVNMPGTYILTVRDAISECTATDTVEVVPNEELPVVGIGFIEQLDCNTSEVTLNINVSNTGGNDVSVRWLDGSGTPLPNGMDTVFAPVVTEPGEYEVLVTNTVTGCTAPSVVVQVVSNISEPTANIEGNTVLGCQETASVFLSAAGSSSGTDFIYGWSSSDTTNLVRTFADSAEVFAPGTYLLTVTDILTGCTATDSVQVTATEERPMVSIAAADPIPCQGGTATLDGSASSAGLFQWVQLEGDDAVIINGTTAVATVDAPGLFGLRVTDAFGCTSLDTIRVTQADTSSIQFEVDYSARDLTCDVNSASVSINVLSDGDYIFNWLPQDEQIIPDPTAASNDIDAPGLIIVEVTETNLNCTREAVVVLNQDAELSDIMIVDDPESLALDCVNGSVTIDASATALNDNESFVWVDPNGTELTQVTTLTPQVTEAGTYTLILSNAENGCSDSLSVEVISASDLLAEIDEAGILTCADNSLLLRAFNSSSGPNIVYEWSSVEGNNINVPPGATNTAIIFEPGTYNLLVRDTETLCEASTSVTVEADIDAPIADAGQDIDLGCGNSIRLGGTMTTTGETISYAWSRDSQNINQTNAQIDIETPGTYTLVVTNERNGCTATDEVIVTQNFQLEQADAGSDESTCDTDSLSLFANLPANATGVWRSNSGAIIDDLSNPETAIGRLDRGDNFFVWTLSTAECPNYSADTVVISVELAPLANNDRAVLDLDKQDSIDIRLIANDNLFNIASWNVDVSEAPKVGTIIGENNGTLTYTAAAFKPTTDQFTYTVCSATCPTLCSSATVTVEIDVPDDVSLLDNQPNVITPNGDGKNDQLIFDLLQNGSFPDNEMIIFNRWGDVVYEAAPYNNDWDGRGLNGKALPHGTYYYILRLDLSEGLILRGDVTIIMRN